MQQHEVDQLEREVSGARFLHLVLEVFDENNVPLADCRFATNGRHTYSEGFIVILRFILVALFDLIFIVYCSEMIAWRQPMGRSDSLGVTTVPFLAS